MIPLTVLGGYLGTGKTTILNKLLNAQHEQRVAVLVNDFGAVNIDATLVRHDTGHQGPIVELANGCVCCSVRDDLGAALESVRATRVDHAIIEASGVALPARIADYGDTWPGYRRAGTLVAVDASNIARQRQDKFVRHLVADQLSQAELLLVTKLDLTSAHESELVLKSLSKPYLDARNGDLPPDVLLDLPLRSSERRIAASALSGHPHFHAFSATTDSPLKRQAIEDLLQALPANVVRAKGWFHDHSGARWLVQGVGDRRLVTPWQAGHAAPCPERAKFLFIAVANAGTPAAIARLVTQTTGAECVSAS